MVTGRSAFGQGVTLSADTLSAPVHTLVNVTATAAGGVGGTVTFLDGGSTIVAVPLSARGTAVLSIASLSIGPHSVGARYVPAAGGPGLTATPVVVSITGLPSSSLAPFSDTVPVIAGKPFGMNAAGLPAGASGTVTFSEAGTALGSVAIQGTATASRPYQAFGDSITQGATLTSPELSYPFLAGGSAGLVTTDYGVPGDMGCDTMGLRILPTKAGPTQTQTPLYSLMIGTTDADYYGTPAHEPIFKACHQATLAWLGVPREYKVLAGDAAVTFVGGWTHTTDVNDGTYLTLYNQTGAGSATFPLTTSGGPIYMWYLQSDKFDGTFTVSVDGVPTGVTYSSRPVAPIGTLNNSRDYSGVVLLRIPADPGAHRVVVTAGSGTVGILGVGTPPSGGTASVHPVVLVTDLPNQLVTNPAAPAAVMGALIQDIQDDLALLSGDGLDLRYTPTRAYMLGTAAEMDDQAHPSVLGQAHLGLAVEAMLGGVSVPEYRTFTAAAAPWTYLTLTKLGAHTIDTTYSGDGNYAGTTVSTQVTVVPKLATTTALTVAGGNYVAGTPVQLTAATTPAEATGTVTFTDGTQTVGGGTVTGGIVQASVQLGVGAHTLVAYYSGDPTYAPSSGAVAGVTVAPNTTTVTLSADAVSAPAHRVVNVTATVQRGTGGTVTFLDGVTPILAVPLSARGTAVLSIASLSVGTHLLGASYAPGGGAAEVGSGSVEVTITLLAAGSFAPYSDTVPAIAGRVFGMNVPGLPAQASGTLTFSESGTVLASLPIAGLPNAGRQYGAFGDSVTAGTALTDPNTRYPVLIAANHGLAMTDYAVGGDVACETLGYRMLRQGVYGATQTASPLYTVMIGGNDASAGSGHEAVFKQCHQGILAWLGVPREYKVLAGDSGVTSSGHWSYTPGAMDATYGTLYNSSGSGTASFPITTSGGPIYLWYLMGDSLQGTFSIRVDGVSTGTAYSSQSSSTLQETNNPDRSGFALLRFPVDPGPHQVEVQLVSGVAGVLGVGTPPSGGSASVHPVVLVSDMPAILSSTRDQSNYLLYTQYAQDDLALLQPDGLDLRFTPTRNYMLGTPAETADQVGHPNALGHAHLAEAFEAVLAGVSEPAFSTFRSAATPWTYLTLTQPGTHVIETSYSGDDTYAPATVSAAVTVVMKPATTTTLTAGSTSYTVGPLLPLSAVVSPADATGTITFVDGTVTLGSGLLVNGIVHYSAQLGAGTHTLVAYYSGDPTYAPSSGAVAGVTVSPVATTVGLGAVPARTAYGTAIGLTAGVTPASAGGTMVFQDLYQGQTVALGQGPVAAGVATLSVANLLPGTHSITASYGGDADDLGSTSAAQTMVVDPVGTSVTVAPIAGVTYGTGLAVLAAVTPAATGTVQFADSLTGNVVQATLTAGVAAGNFGGLGVGAHSIVATYAGDTIHSGSTSAAIVGQVSQAGSAVALTVANGVVAAGSAVTFSVRVTPAGASGVAVLRDAGGNGLGQVQLVNGVGTVSTSVLGVGNYLVTASYGGDGNYLGSVSGVVAVQVVKPATVTSVAVAQASVAAGTAEIVSVRVSGTGTITPTGTVVLRANGTAVATVALVGGLVRINVGTPSLGMFALTADYGGDALYAGSEGLGSYAVVADATAGTLGVSAGQVAVGMPVGLTAVFRSGAGVPAGLVTFRSAGAVVGTAGLDGAGQARVTWMPAAPGTYGVTASLVGTGVFGGSDASGVTVLVTNPLTLSAGASVTVAPGGTGTASVGVTPLSGFQGSVTASCSSPVGFVTCTVDPLVTVNGPTAVTVRVSVASGAGLGLLLMPPMLAFRRRRQRWWIGLGMLLALAGCASGGNFNSVPSGPQALQVYVTAAGVMASSTVTVVVK